LQGLRHDILGGVDRLGRRRSLVRRGRLWDITWRRRWRYIDGRCAYNHGRGRADDHRRRSNIHPWPVIIRVGIVGDANADAHKNARAGMNCSASQSHRRQSGEE